MNFFFLALAGLYTVINFKKLGRRYRSNNEFNCEFITSLWDICQGNRVDSVGGVESGGSSFPRVLLYQS